MDPIMQFLSSTSVDSSDPLWEDSQYVSPRNKRLKKYRFCNIHHRSKKRGGRVEQRFFLKAKTSMYVSHG
jgi:hypothetical protein